MSIPHVGFTLTKFHNGKVLASGGQNSNSQLSSAEIYDPSTGTWTLTGSLNYPRFQHAAAQLNSGSGQVIVSGGSNTTQAAEVFSVSTGTWSLTGSMNSARYYHRSLQLNSGHILVVGGRDYTGSPLSTAELFTP